MDIERDTDGDLEDFERLPGGTIVTDALDIRYVRNLRERAQLNRPDEPESEPVAAEPSAELLDDLAALHSRTVELVEIIQGLDEQNRALQAQVATLCGNPADPLYSREMSRLLDSASLLARKEDLVAINALIVAKDQRWQRLKLAPAICGWPLSTIRDRIDAGLIRSRQIGGTVWVCLTDIQVQQVLALRGRQRT